jgi:hypothetical protein
MHLARIRPRFTVRRLMVAVAIVGMGLGFCGWMSRRAEAFQARATSHASLAFRASVADRVDIRLMEHHRDLAFKYSRASRCPWLPVEPDPPEPK